MRKQWRKKHSITLLGLSLIHVLLHVVLSSDFGGLYSGDQCCACGFKVRSLNAFPCLLTTIEAEAGSQCTSLSLSLSLSDSHSLLPLLTHSWWYYPVPHRGELLSTPILFSWLLLCEEVECGISAQDCANQWVLRHSDLYILLYMRLYKVTQAQVCDTKTTNPQLPKTWSSTLGERREVGFRGVKHQASKSLLFTPSSKRIVNAGYSFNALNSR